MELKELLGYKDSDINIDFLLEKFNETEEELNINNFKNFVDNFTNDSIEFEKNTGVPCKYYQLEINLRQFENLSIRRSCFGYTKVRDIYIYVNDKFNIVFKRNCESLLEYSPEKKDILMELNKFIDYEEIIRDPKISDILYTNKFLNIEKMSNIYIRYFFGAIYDIVLEYDNLLHTFWSEENFNEEIIISHCFTGTFEDRRKKAQQIKRMLKLNKMLIKTSLNKY